MNKKLKITLLLLLYQVPVLLVFLGIIDYKHRYIVLALVTIAIFAYTIFQKYTLRDLGFRPGNLRKDILYNVSFCTIIALGLVAAYYLNLIRKPTIPDWKFFFIFYVFISSPLQEFLFRSLPFHELKQLNIGNTGQVIISAVNFSLMHIIYHDLATYCAALAAGLCLGIIYNKTRSIYGVSLSHAVIGAVSIYVGLV